MRKAPLLTLLGIAMWWASPAAEALGIGRTASTSTLGQPLDLVAAIQLDADEVLTSRCLSAVVLAGDSPVRADRVRLMLEAGSDARQRRVRITTTSPIAEPVVTINLTVGCQARVTRRFVTLINPPMPPSLAATTAPSEPLELEPPAARDAATHVAVLPASGESRTDVTRFAPSGRGRPARQGTFAPAAPTPAIVAAAAAPRKVTEPDAKVVATIAASPAQADHVRELEAGLATLRDDAARRQQSLAELQARLHEVEGSRGMNPLVYTIGAFALLLAGVVAGMWRLLRPKRARVAAAVAVGKPAKPRVKAVATKPIHATKANEAPEAVVATRAELPVLRDRAVLANDDAAALERLIEPAGAARETSRSRPRPQPLDDASLGGLEVTQVLDPAMHARVQRSSRADGTFSPSTFGRLAAADTRGHGPSMADLIDVEQQAEFHLAMGQDDAAVALLDRHISNGGGSPLPFLKLLEIHQRQRDEAAYNRVRQQFNERFKAHAPEWTEHLQSGRSLDQYPATLETVQTAWGAPIQAMKMLDGLLFRRSANDDAFDFAAYRELLFLYSIARDLSGDVKPAMGADVDLVLPLDEESIALLSRRMKASLPTVSANASRLDDLDASLENVGAGPISAAAGRS